MSRSHHFHGTQVNLVLHPSGVTKSTTNFASQGKVRTIASAEWQIILCDAIWHASSRNGEAKLLLTAICLPFESPERGYSGITAAYHRKVKALMLIRKSITHWTSSALDSPAGSWRKDAASFMPGKVLPYLLPSIGPRADLGVQSVTGVPVVLKFQSCQKLPWSQKLSWNFSHLVRMSWYWPF